MPFRTATRGHIRPAIRKRVAKTTHSDNPLVDRAASRAHMVRDPLGGPATHPTMLNQSVLAARRLGVWEAGAPRHVREGPINFYLDFLDLPGGR